MSDELSSDRPEEAPRDTMPEGAAPPPASVDTPEAETKPPPGPPLAPVASDERFESIDVLRGFAVLGILAMNIYFFGMPASAYDNPTAYGGATGINLGTWVFTHLFFDQKFMTIFSALFGAGVVIQFERAQARNRPLARTYYRRILWLLVFGLIHAYLIWGGDILTTYAVAGLLLFLFRRRSAKALIITGIILLQIPTMTSVGFGLYVGAMKTAKQEVVTLAEGESPTEEQQKLVDSWEEMRSFLAPTEEEIQEEVEIYRGNYGEMVKHRAPMVLMFQTMALGFFILWRAGGIMLLGMALMKLGVLSARRSPAFYRKCLMWGYGIGLPLVALSAWDLIRVQWEKPHSLLVSSHLNYYGSLFVALGHIGMIMLVCQNDAMTGLRRRLAAAGRMAFSNYLMQSVICTTIFYGYGFGLFGHLNRFYLMGVVLAVWLFQLWYSPWWLARFRFGPAEWLWRSLTYGRRERMTVAKEASHESTA